MLVKRAPTVGPLPSPKVNRVPRAVVSRRVPRRINRAIAIRSNQSMGQLHTTVAAPIGVILQVRRTPARTAVWLPSKIASLKVPRSFFDLKLAAAARQAKVPADPSLPL